MSRQSLVAALATTTFLFGLNAASAATVSGSVERTSDYAFAFTSNNLAYADGSAFSNTDLMLFCLEPTKSTPTDNTVYRFDEDPTGRTLRGGASSVAAINWFVDSYYDSYFVNGSAGTQWAFQYGLWELSADYTGADRSINARAGESRPGQDNVRLQGFRTAWQTIYNDFGTTLRTLGDDYRSDVYAIAILDTQANGRQNLVAISERPADVPSVPLPAAGWLLVGGIGALAATKRRR
ncbi:VPLPA-CTERM sorting domain-containing protein [Paenirhodobacter sp.]|uniref:VPLPA-CTERM sorting domain-containing protein n=1 Tax=Paenirhodobacter sp. TaxID=1965326 RepID=UPI003B3DC8C7